MKKGVEIKKRNGRIRKRYGEEKDWFPIPICFDNIHNLNPILTMRIKFVYLSSA
jgi:hypothetical protein